jgi:hypothetical protein
VVRCGEDVRSVSAGSWVPFPRAVPHTFRVVGGPARILQVHADDSFLRLVREIGQPAGSRRLPDPTGGPGIQALSEALARHGVSNVGPSLTEDEAQALLAALPV